MKKITFALLMGVLLFTCFSSVPKSISAQDTSVRDFVNLLISIGVIPQDKIQSVNDFLLTLEPTDASTTTSPIYDIEITTESDSARVEWRTTAPTESKVFVDEKTLFSKRGIGTRHYVVIDGLENDSRYTGTITAISGSSWESKDITFRTEDEREHEADDSSSGGNQITKGELWIAGSPRGFQVTLANFTEGTANLEVTPPVGMKDSGRSGTECSGGICTYIGRFILEGGTYSNALELPTNRTYKFIIKAFGETYISELNVDDEKTLMKDSKTIRPPTTNGGSGLPTASA